MGDGNHIPYSALGDEAVKHDLYWIFASYPDRGMTCILRISVSGLGSLRLGGCWPFTALGDGNHIPALVGNLGEAYGFLSSFPEEA